jgi:hypothetical protein
MKAWKLSLIGLPGSADNFVEIQYPLIQKRNNCCETTATSPYLFYKQVDLISFLVMVFGPETLASLFLYKKHLISNFFANLNAE